VGHHLLAWGDRCLPSDAQVPNNLRPGCWGLPWEWVVAVAQQTGKGVWVNHPVTGTGALPVNTTSYAYQWATLLRDGNAATGGKGVPVGTPIYLEHSNEVWNYVSALPPPLPARRK
jgi:hypothetical protein